jgi:hypothetical protein
MDLRLRLATLTDRLIALVLVSLLTGTTAAFGGRVWWAPLAVGALCLALVLLGLTRALLAGSVRVLKSPLTALGVLALGLAAVQLVPLPGRVSARLSPASRAAYGLGLLPDRVRTIDPTVELPDGPSIRSPVSVDRAATVRWLAGASACLGVFWVVGQYADRLGHLYVVWGGVIAAFFLNTAVAAVQLACGSRRLFGFIEPGGARAWAPNWDDLLAAPGASVLRAAGASRPGHPDWALAVADRPEVIGTQMGGPGAYLALGSIGLPLALALTLQLLAPRGSRESLGARLGQSGQGSLVVLLYGLLLVSSVVVGLLAGPAYGLAIGAALVVVGLPGAWPSGLRWSAVGLTLLAVSALGGGAALGEVWARSEVEPRPVAPEDARAAARVWADALPITHDFPVLGTGLGTFSTVYPFYKTGDRTATTAMSSLLQWWVESGYVGLGLLAVGALWCLARLPGAVRGVGSADRCLAYGLIGAALGFTLFAVVHWSVELASVALAASAVGGAWNRWLAGGTDLFVERG